MSLESYFAYYTASVALRVVLRKKVRAEIKAIEAPKGKKTKVKVRILGKTHYDEYPIDPEAYLDRVSESQALNGVEGLPLKDPSGCTWSELWSAYKERYIE